MAGFVLFVVPEEGFDKFIDMVLSLIKVTPKL